MLLCPTRLRLGTLPLARRSGYLWHPRTEERGRG